MSFSVYILVSSFLAWQLAAPHVASASHGDIRLAHVSLGGSYAPLWIAKESGLFKKHGIEVRLDMIQSTQGVVPALVSGDLDIVLAGAAGPLGAILAGAEIRIFGSHLKHLVYKLFVRSEIQNATDLKGKKIGVQRFGDTSEYANDRALEHLGLDPKRDARAIQIGDISARLAAMEKGLIDATTGNPIDQLRFRKAGFRVLLDLQPLKIPYAGVVYSARKEFLDGHMRNTRSFLEAMVEAIYIYKTNKDFALKVIQKYGRIRDPEILEASYMGYESAISELPKVNLDSLKVTLEELGHRNPKAKAIRAEAIVDNRLIEEIERSGVVEKLYGR